MRLKRTFTYLVIILLFGLLIFGGILVYKNQTNKGTLSLLYEPKDAKVSINGTEIKQTNPKISTGDHTIVIEKDGYISETSKVQIKKGETTKLQVFLSPLTTESTISQTIENSDIYKELGIAPKFKVGHFEEFYNKSWVVAVVFEKGSAAMALTIFKKSPDTGLYELLSPPFTSYDPKLLETLPLDVQNSITKGDWFNEKYLEGHVHE